jgi:hypothetical protein
VRDSIDDVDEVKRLRAIALELIRNRLAPSQFRGPEPFIEARDVAGVFAVLVELSARCVRGNAAAVGTTPADVLDQLVRMDDERAGT